VSSTCRAGKLAARDRHPAPRLPRPPSARAHCAALRRAALKRPWLPLTQRGAGRRPSPDRAYVSRACARCGRRAAPAGTRASPGACVWCCRRARRPGPRRSPAAAARSPVSAQAPRTLPNPTQAAGAPAARARRAGGQRVDGGVGGLQGRLAGDAPASAARRASGRLWRQGGTGKHLAVALVLEEHAGALVQDNLAARRLRG